MPVIPLYHVKKTHFLLGFGRFHPRIVALSDPVVLCCACHLHIKLVEIWRPHGLGINAAIWGYMIYIYICNRLIVYGTRSTYMIWNDAELEYNSTMEIFWYMPLCGINMNRLGYDGYYPGTIRRGDWTVPLSVHRFSYASLQWTILEANDHFGDGYGWLKSTISQSPGSRPIWCWGRSLFPDFAAAHFLVLRERPATWPAVWETTWKILEAVGWWPG